MTTKNDTIVYLSNIGLPCAASEPRHAVRKQEIDEEISSLQAQIDNLQSASKRRFFATLSDFTFRSTETIHHAIQSLNYGVDIWFLKGNTQTTIETDDNNAWKTINQIIRITKYPGYTEFWHLPDSGFININVAVCIWEY